MSAMLSRLWKTFIRVVVIAGCFVLFLVFLEVVRAYQTLREMNYIVGYVFLAMVCLVVLWLIGRLMGGWRLRRRVLVPPPIDDVDTAGVDTLRKYCVYLVKYLRRLGANAALSQEHRHKATEGAAELPGRARKCKDREELLAAIRETEQERIEPALAELDELAETEIRQCVFHVMTAVAASLWNSIDVLIVLYRNGRMITRITQIYNSRPALREQIGILLDTVKVVAMIKLASMTASLLTKGRRAVPMVGRATESLAQAVGAGVLTSAAGHTAKLRCKAFRGWDRKEAERHLGEMVGQYLQDCWEAARQCVWPVVVETAGNATSVAWDKVKEGFGAAVDATAAAADSFVVKPVSAGAGAVANGGRSVFARATGLFRRKP